MFMPNLFEIQMFAIVMILPLIGTMLGLLHYNWFPAKVFVGDTFCYFAGMAFAVIGIHGHFSKTLLLLFIPQVINFIYSIPQLFKMLPCPRHRLPRVDATTHLMNYSVFPCEKHEYRWFKVRKDDVECPNCTFICLVLRTFGPMTEPNLCVCLLAIQAACSVLVFWLRYHVFA
jgi:UDP-N-acetylglucosamine--dolichyl-phosphate N-acetylglucosaminephosphotransferase